MLAETKLNPIRPRDTRGFWDPLDGFVTGVTVVTSRATAGCTGGVMVHSFALLSLDPPRELVTGIVEPPRLRGKAHISSSMCWPKAPNALLRTLPDRESIDLQRLNSERAQKAFGYCQVSPPKLSAVGFAGRGP